MKARIFIASGAFLVLPVMAQAADLASTAYVQGAIQAVRAEIPSSDTIDTLAAAAISDAIENGGIGLAIDAAVGYATSELQGEIDTLSGVVDTKANLVTGSTQTLQAVGQAGVFAIVDSTGQPQRGFTVGDLATHVQAQVDANIPDAVNTVMGDIEGQITAVSTAVDNLGTAADQNVEYFATAAQGSLADTALQSNIACLPGQAVIQGATAGTITCMNIATEWLGTGA